MNVLRTLTSNYIINVGVVAWFLAQVLKTLFTFLLTKKLDLERMVGAGGMPSSHSALTASIAIAMARKLGFASPEFGLSIAFAAVVMYDAMGVRRAAGEQAKVLNKLIFSIPFLSFFNQEDKEIIEEVVDTAPGLSDSDADPVKAETAEPFIDKELKEFLGHTPMEVLGGCLLGILVAIFMPVI